MITQPYICKAPKIVGGDFWQIVSFNKNEYNRDEPSVIATIFHVKDKFELNFQGKRITKRSLVNAFNVAKNLYNNGEI